MPKFDIKLPKRGAKSKGAESKSVENNESSEDKQQQAAIEKAVRGLPDVHSAKIDAYKYDKRVRMHFEVPEILKDEFIKKAREEHKKDKSLGLLDENGNVIMKRFFYFCLRKAGMDIPNDEELDARMRVRK